MIWPFRRARGRIPFGYSVEYDPEAGAYPYRLRNSSLRLVAHSTSIGGLLKKAEEITVGLETADKINRRLREAGDSRPSD